MTFIYSAVVNYYLFMILAVFDLSLLTVCIINCSFVNTSQRRRPTSCICYNDDHLISGHLLNPRNTTTQQNDPRRRRQTAVWSVGTYTSRRNDSSVNIGKKLSSLVNHSAKRNEATILDGAARTELRVGLTQGFAPRLFRIFELFLSPSENAFSTFLIFVPNVHNKCGLRSCRAGQKSVAG